MNRDGTNRRQLTTDPTGESWWPSWGGPPAPQYHVCLLYDPTKAANSGSTIPVKLQLCDANGANLSAPGLELHAVSVVQAGTGISGPVQNSGHSNPGNDFRYDATVGGTGGYIYNLSTRGLPSGSYVLAFRVGAASTLYGAPFRVR